jgi:hypothetical protein
MKRITVKVTGSERELQEITIKPGDTVGEVLARLNLEDYVLSLQPNTVSSCPFSRTKRICIPN